MPSSSIWCDRCGQPVEDHPPRCEECEAWLCPTGPLDDPRAYHYLNCPVIDSVDGYQAAHEPTDDGCVCGWKNPIIEWGTGVHTERCEYGHVDCSDVQHGPCDSELWAKAYKHHEESQP